MLHRGGTVARAQRSAARGARRRPVVSPSRRGVIVDDAGALVGTVRAARGAHRHRADRPARARATPPTPGAAGRRHDLVPRPHRRRCCDAGGRSTPTSRACRWSSGSLIALPLGLAGPPLLAALRAVHRRLGLLYTIPSLALFVILPGHPRHPDPRPGQRRRRDDPLHRGAARAHRRRRPRRGARPRPAGRDRDGLHAGASGSSRSSCPLAVPVIAAGLRVAAVSNVSIVSVAHDHRRHPARAALHRRLQPRLLRPAHRRHRRRASCWPCVFDARHPRWSRGCSPRGCERRGPGMITASSTGSPTRPTGRAPTASRSAARSSTSGTPRWRSLIAAADRDPARAVRSATPAAAGFFVVNLAGAARAIPSLGLLFLMVALARARRSRATRLPRARA